MKKLGLLVMPLMAVSLLASCNNSTDICVVTFNSNGGSFVETQKVKKGDTVHEPEDPTRDKYDFAGWCLDGSIFEFSTKITQDIILTANWDKIPEPGVTHTIGFSGSDCKAGKTADDLKEIFQISCEEGEINLIVSPNDNFALTNKISFLVDGVKVAPKSYIQDGSNYKLTFQLSGETLIYVDALPVSTSHKVTFSGDEHCSMFYGSEPVTSSGIEIPVIDADPYYVRFTIKADDSTYMKPGTLSLNSGAYTDYFFNKDNGDLFINLQEAISVTGTCDIYKSLEEMSWAQIAGISESEKADKVFNIGDTKTVKVNNQDHKIRIIGFNHDALKSDKTKTAGITFEFANVITNSEGNADTTFWDLKAFTNYKYSDSTLNDYLNVGENCIFKKLPDELKADGIIKEVYKPVAEGSSYEINDAYTTKLFPLSYREITATGKSDEAKEEGSAYPFYTGEGYDTNGNRIKRKVGIESGNGEFYWLRSPYTYLSNLAWRCDDDGILGNVYVYSNAFAVAPAFCI